MEKIIVEQAMKAMKEGEFNCMPMPEYRDSTYQFKTATQNMVAEAGYQLKWLNTFKGGCWHVIPAA